MKNPTFKDAITQLNWFSLAFDTVFAIVIISTLLYLGHTYFAVFYFGLYYAAIASFLNPVQKVIKFKLFKR